MQLKTLAILSAVTAFSAAPAFAAATSTGSTTPPSANNSSPAPDGAGHIGQSLHQDLTKAGFTDIRIAPEAFIVHAKNSAGDPVLMRIGPDAVTELTEVPTNSNHAANGTQGNTGNTTHAAK